MALFNLNKKKKETDGQSPKAIVPVTAKVLGSFGVNTLAIKRPHISERASDVAAQGVYVFDVDSKATKPQIRAAIVALFKVTPVKVRTVTIHPKKIIVKGRPGVRRGGKKAYVYLKKGEKIEVV